MIHYISPFDVNRNFGTSINFAINQINPLDEDWICLRDGDACFLTPDYGRIIDQAVGVYSDEYDLIGCTTNRLGGTDQLAPNMFDEMDLRQHYWCAETRHTLFNSGVEPFSNDVAGFFMLFNVKIWRKIGGFKNSIVFDREFTKAVRMNGGKVGIMPGLYVLHCYRLWAPTREEARKSVDHLIK